MTDVRWSHAIFGAGALAIVACGSSEGAGRGSPDACANGCWTPTADDQSFLASFCALTVNCCTSTGLAPTATADSCVSAALSGGLIADSSVRAACLTELQSLAGTSSCIPEPGNIDDPCVRLFNEPSGPQQPGERCTKNADCAGAPGTITECTRNPQTGTTSACIRMAPGQAGSGTCLGEMVTEALTVFAAFDKGTGAPPVFSGYYCSLPAGLYCDTVDESLATPQCKPAGGGGAPCSYSGQCASQTCMNSGEGMPGTCLPVVSIGEPCWSGEANIGVCDGTSFCSYPVTGPASCTARLPAGATCTADGVCESSSCACVGADCASEQCSVQSSAEQLAIVGSCGQLP
jgi:hypothetical protein